MIPVHDSANQRFLLALGEGEAFLEYVKSGQVITFTHTFVPPSMRGLGVGEVLVRHGLIWAQQNHLEIASTCDYVTRYMTKNPIIRQG